MLVVIGSGRLQSVIAGAVKSAQEQSEKDARSALETSASIVDLRKQLTALEIERDRKNEEWARREREIEHKVGLERKRQEVEIEQAKRETAVTVREESLKAEKERFKSEMDFQRKRLEEEVTALRTLVGQMMERLPSAEIYADLTGGKRK